MKTNSILSLLLILGMAACTATPAAVTEAATAVPTSIPSTSTVAPIEEPIDEEPTPVPIAKIKTFPGARCCNGTPLEPGEYELPSWMDIPLTMELGEGWQVVNEQDARLFMLGKGESVFNDPTQALVFIAISNGDPQAILVGIEEDPGLAASGEVTETAIAGLPGLQLDLSAKPNPDYGGDKEAEIPPGVQFLPSVGQYFAEGFFWTTWSAEASLRFIVLDLGEHVLLLQIDAPAAEFESFAGEADEVLQTLKVRN